MRTRSLILAFTLAAAGCATVRFGTLDGVLTGDRVAVGSELQEVQVVRPGAAAATTLGMDVRKGDRIVTGPDVQAVVSLAAGYELILEPGTDVEILNPSLFMRIGQAFIQTGERVREYLKVKTEYVFADVEGTRLVATVRGGEFLLAVADGHVKLESATGAWPARVYGPLEQARVRGAEPPESMPPLDPRQADTIRARFQRVDDITRRRIPALIGTRLEDARAAVMDAGLTVGQVRERITGAPIGTVVGQDPAPGAVVRAGGRVDLTVEGESLLVPDVRARALPTAVAMLREAGLQVGGVIESLSANEPEGTVLSQSRRPLSRVKPGTTVQLTVAVAGVAVPDLRRLDQRQAASRLRESGLALGQTSSVKASGYGPGTVAGQNPSPGTLVRRGSVVNLSIAAGVVEGRAVGAAGATRICRVPTLVNHTEAEAKVLASKSGLTLGRVRRCSGQAAASARITSQTPAPESTVTCGSYVEAAICPIQ